MTVERVQRRVAAFKAWSLPPAVARAVTGVATVGIVGLTLCLCGRFGFFHTFAGFRTYDDEGMMLIGLDQLARGRVLYDQVVTMYGPFGFVPRLAVVKAVGLPIGHDTGRFMTLGFWWLTCLLVGAGVWRMTRSVAWFAVAAVVTCVTLGPIRNEPGHPQDLCGLLLAAAVLVGAVGTTGGSRKAGWAIAGLGVIGGLLLTTKINVGAFYCLALTAALVLHLRPGLFRRVVVSGVVVVLLVTPWLLMRGHLGQERIVTYAWVATVSLASCCTTAVALGQPGEVGVGRLSLCVAAIFLTVAAVCGAAVLLGTSFDGLLEGMVRLPLRFSKGLAVGVETHEPWAGALVVAAWVMAAAAAAWRLHTAAPSRSLTATVGALRLGVALFAIHRVAWHGWEEWAPAMSVLPAFAWLLLVGAGQPPAGRHDDAIGPAWPSSPSWPRAFLALLAVLESMWAFPVAGSQVAFSLLVPLAAAVVCAADGVRDLAGALPGRLPATLVCRCVPIALMGVLLYRAQELGQASSVAYRSLTPLGLPGTRLVRVPSDLAVKLRTVVANLRENADLFYTRPGLNSFHFWAEMPPPTPTNVTAWMYLLTDEQQAGVVRVLQSHPRACVVHHPGLEAFWLRSQATTPRTSLTRYLSQDFTVAADLDGYHLLVRKDRPRVVIVRPDGVKRADPSRDNRPAK